MELETLSNLRWTKFAAIFVLILYEKFEPDDKETEWKNTLAEND